MYQNSSDQAKDSAEHLLLCVHFFNIVQGLKCTGLTEDDPESDERLPSLWNANTQLYSFRYSVGEGHSLYVKGVKLNEDALMLHAMRSDKSDAIHNLSLSLTTPTAKLQGGEDFVKYVCESVLPLYREQIFAKVKSQPKSSLLIEEHRPPFRPDPRADWQNPYNPYNPYVDPRNPMAPQFQPFPIGRGDLMPGGLGGSHMGPDNPMFRPGGFRPGVRFDPIHPLNPRGLGGPDPDHFGPPGPRGPFF